jgi:RNA polymerase sigma-70 factor, ECF subfamily
MQRLVMDGVMVSRVKRGESTTVSADDQALIARLVAHDADALGLLYDRYGRLAYAIALRITGSRDVAEEVVQDAFYNVWRDAASFRPQTGSVTSWISAITRHRAIDATRSKRFQAGRREEAMDMGLPVGDADSPERQTDERLLRQEVLAALRELPAPQRQAIELAYYGGMTRSEIAEQLGEPIGTIKTRLRLGMARLRSLLRPHGPDSLD